MGEKNNFMERIGKENQENALEVRILDRLSSSKKTLVSEYFDPAEVEGALKELQKGGTVFGSLDNKEFVEMLQGKGIMEKRPLPRL